MGGLHSHFIVKPNLVLRLGWGFDNRSSELSKPARAKIFLYWSLTLKTKSCFIQKLIIVCSPFSSGLCYLSQEIYDYYSCLEKKAISVANRAETLGVT